MITTFTRNDIIRYVYNETSSEENALIEHTLLAEPDLQDFYEELLEIKYNMDRINPIPSDSAIQNIFFYSQNYSSTKAEHYSL